MYFCDDAIIVTNPELSALRDGDKMVGFIWYVPTVETVLQAPKVANIHANSLSDAGASPKEQSWALRSANRLTCHY
jgi:hypothetical protein